MRGSAEQQGLERHNEALRALARSTVWRSRDIEAAFRLLTEVASRTLEVERVSIWLYDPARSQIECRALFEANDSKLTRRGVALRREDYPIYFDAMDENRTIAASNARTDARTIEFSTDYLPSLGIQAMLDAPILSGGDCIGVVCHENVGTTRVWTAEEQAFAGSIADFAALAVEANQRAVSERALRQRERELRTALEAAGMGTWSLDIASQDLTCSPEVSQLFGILPPQAVDMNSYLARVHEGDRAQVQEKLYNVLHGQAVEYSAEHRVLWPDGSEHWIEFRGRVQHDENDLPVTVAGVVMNLDERRSLEEQVRQAQRMEGLGRLAGGIAHDFNNLLTVISMSVSWVQRELQHGRNAPEQLEDIRSSVDRATALTSQLLSFARKRPVASKIFDVHKAVTQMANMLQRLLGEEIELRVSLGKEPACIRTDLQQFEQVLMNLTVNARDAMPKGGRIEIRVNAIEGNEDPHGTVQIEVEDSGSGIPDEAMTHIFEPFFTTKPIGKGTGLGLATSYGIVRQAGGSIFVASTSPKGTTFAVRFPRVSARAGLPATVPAQAWTQGSARVLFVEDEKVISALATRVLSDAGYQIVRASSPAEALEIVSAGNESFDILVTDVVMPGMRGPELAAKLRERIPKLQVLFITGFSDVDLGDAPLLAKPFTPEALLASVQQVLES